jgi:hypothetical protein
MFLKRVFQKVVNFSVLVLQNPLLGVYALYEAFSFGLSFRGRGLPVVGEAVEGFAQHQSVYLDTRYGNLSLDSQLEGYVNLGPCLLSTSMSIARSYYSKCYRRCSSCSLVTHTLSLTPCCDNYDRYPVTDDWISSSEAIQRFTTRNATAVESYLEVLAAMLGIPRAAPTTSGSGSAPIISNQEDLERERRLRV